MTDWISGDAYLWIKAAHVVFVVFWMAGMFMLPRYFVYHMAAGIGTPEDAVWMERERRLLRIIINPSMILVWVLGLTLAFAGGWWSMGWLHIKFAIVVLLSGYHGWLSGLRRKFARGERPVSERALRIANEVPSFATIAIVILVIVKPF